METKIAKVGGWNKFAPVFIAIGVSSFIMGLLTGEFFATETVLEPFSRFVTGLFGEPRHAILPMMPTGSKESIIRMFTFFGFTVGVGFIINSVGLLLNICNQFALGKKGKALFGKTGLSGAIFFWYVVFIAIRVFALKKPENILEIGTGVAYSAIFMASLLPPEGRIVTIENYEERILKARENIKNSGFEGKIRVVEADAADVLPGLEERFDLIFLDAAKGQYILFLPRILELMEPGSVLIADNVLQDGEIVRSRYVTARRQRTIHERMRELDRKSVV